MGAGVVGAGRTLGLTDDEAIETKKATLRRQQRERRAQRGQREGNRAAAEAFLAEEDAKFQQKARAELRDLGLGDRAREIDDVAFAFGEDPEYDMYAKDGIDLVKQEGKKRRTKEQRFRMKGQDERMRPQDDGQNYNIMERAYMGLEADADDINDPDLVRQAGRYVRGADGKRKWEEGGRLYDSPGDVEGRIDNANPRQREPGGKEQGYRAVNDAVNRLREAEQYGYENFGAEGPEMERIAREAGRRANEANAVRGDREQAQFAAREDRRMRAGDLTETEIKRRVARKGREARPSAQVYTVGADMKDGNRQLGDGGHPLNVSGLFQDRDIDAIVQAENELRARKARGQRADVILQGVRVDDRAYADAMSEAAQLPEGYVRMRDRNLGNLVEIQPEKFGGLGKASHDPRISMDFVEERFDNPSSFGYATPLMRDGKAIGYYGEDMVELGNINLPDSANALNAPEMTPGQSFVAEYLPQYGKEGGTNFGYPQVGSNEELALFGDRVRALPGYGYENVGNPRNLGEVEAALGAIKARAGKLGKNFYRPTPEGKNQKITDPGINDILYAMGYAQDFNGQPNAEKQRLANALYQIEAANKVDVNQANKIAYAARQAQPARTGFTEDISFRDGGQRTPVRDDVRMNAAELRIDQGTPIARIPRGAKVGGKQVNAGLRAISEDNVIAALEQAGQLYGPDGKITPQAADIIVNAREARNDAQQPFMGAIEGEPPARARFIKGAARKMSPDELVAKYGEENARKALEVEMRYERDKRAQGASPIDPYAQIQRQMDERMAGEANQARINAEDAVIGRLYQDMAYGREIDAPDEFVGDAPQDKFKVKLNSAGEQINFPERVPGAKRGEGLRVPPRSAFVSDDSPAARAPGKIVNGQRVEMPGRPNFRRPEVAPSASVSPSPVPIQPTRPAQVAPSIAPDPWAMTGPARTPITEAGGGGQQPTGGPFGLLGAAPEPARQQGPTRPMTGDMRDLLFSLDGPYTDRPRSNEYMTSPDGPATRENAVKGYGERVRREAPERGQKVLDSLNAFRTQDKYKNYRRGGYGAAGLAGLATILNLGNDDEQEEV